MEKSVLICPSCRRIYFCEEKNGTCTCGTALLPLGVTEEEWNNMSVPDKNILVGRVLGLGAMDNHADSRRNEEPEDPYEDEKPEKPVKPGGFFWINFMNVMADIFIVLGIAASVLGGGYVGYMAIKLKDAQYLIAAAGILVGGILSTLIVVAMTKVALGAAGDIRKMRNRICK